MKDPRRFTIREAQPADADRLAAFGARLFREAFAAFNRPEDIDAYVAGAFAPQRQLSILAADRVTTLLCQEAAAWVGYVELWPGAIPGQAGTDDALEIRRFYVERRWHGSGAAQALLAAVGERATALGSPTLWLGVWDRNERAAAFYRKAGFRKTGSQDFLLGNDRQTDNVMVCAVDALRTA